MGRKRWWTRGSSLILLFLLLIHGAAVQGADEVGCLFDNNICTSPEETCFNDNAFGRCIRPLDALDDGIYRYDLGPEDLQTLGQRLEALVAENYDWFHPYTQCVMQNALIGVRYGMKLAESCEILRNKAGEDIGELIADGGEEAIRPLAVVHFMPTRGHGYGDFANELYTPPLASPFEKGRPATGDNDPFSLGEDQEPPIRHPTLNFDNELALRPDIARKVVRKEEKLDPRLASVFRSRRIPRGQAPVLADNWDYLSWLEEERKQPKKSVNIFVGNRTLPEALQELTGRNYDDEEQALIDDETLDDNQGAGDGGFTDEFFVPPLDVYEQEPKDIEMDDLPTFLWTRDVSGFKRPERLDVKKPGPLFSTNNYAFKTQKMSGIDEDNEFDDKEDLRPPFVKKELIAGSDITRLSMGKNAFRSYDNVDMDCVYIQFKEEFHKWSEGEAVVEKVAELLGLKLGELSGTRVGRAEVTFKVNKNSQNLNAMNVVTRLDDIRDQLRETMHKTIVRAGIGDKAKLPPMLEVTNLEPSMSSALFAAIVAAGVTAAAAAAVVTLVIARRHAKSRAKLAGLATPDPEASKDYQALCRARMQAKQPAEKPESPRLAHLSKESESNRSSTSSWGGEEAASLSNMDISTGHMVLSYMEDHLKNKDRLNQEWAGICAYEADPSSIAAATDKSNDERNRSGSALPYDHSRVVLNDLANLNNSDYINASTITDHDPRNPAYIATQGPLPQTSADFWQLVWEQGSVVIVMLTRLTEEGRAMCHRYWPEEGSELYHIYEVHLVSEHIWCDDYLVRSFYLKNLRTGETRTVTQFHFLSWPENGVPQSTKALLEFRRKVNKSYRGRSCPIVVHCSDGAGRTGTYCLIDMVLNRMAKGAKAIDIAAALEHIRDQRPGMVATKQQFEFVLVAVAEEVHAILKALPVVEKSSTATNATATSSSSGAD